MPEAESDDQGPGKIAIDGQVTRCLEYVML